MIQRNNLNEHTLITLANPFADLVSITRAAPIVSIDSQIITEIQKQKRVRFSTVQVRSHEVIYDTSGSCTPLGLGSKITNETTHSVESYSNTENNQSPCEVITAPVPASEAKPTPTCGEQSRQRRRRVSKSKRRQRWCCMGYSNDQRTNMEYQRRMQLRE